MCDLEWFLQIWSHLLDNKATVQTGYKFNTKHVSHVPKLRVATRVHATPCV